MSESEVGFYSRLMILSVCYGKELSETRFGVFSIAREMVRSTVAVWLGASKEFHCAVLYDSIVGEMNKALKMW
ncbi:hypothetical protein J2S36_000717 [Arcanobacterium hippocoleae]|uniref:Uncharacterized protein n=1 Tax=Arcanobacterium hippocoleae TaxID=149017 RepID=A0ABU1T1B7_9ACTO|nr:hypothetical protein [Arcanobacterium hippocoleae]MDR6939174.1 hypothetical protein [Arcanobacterium hippocoleae]